MSNHRWLAAGLGLASLLGCAGSNGGGESASEVLPGEAGISLGRGETLPSFVPASTPEKNFAEGEKAFADENYLLAYNYYRHIRQKFPYSNYAVLSDLRIADVNFERERFLEAIDGYESFVRLHPSHPQVPYAMFRAGKAHHRLIPNDWFIMPASHEKDQTQVRETAEVLSRFVQRFPDHDDVVEAQKLLDEVRERLLAHERYVADFYAREGKIRGYVGRLERIRTLYADVGLDADLLLEIVRAYVRLEDLSNAERTLRILETEFSGAKETEAARGAVSALAEARHAADAAAEATQASPSRSAESDEREARLPVEDGAGKQGADEGGADRAPALEGG